MEISVALVKELREKTGLGMMVCKQALIENNGNMEAAIESLRKQGQATAAKRAGRSAKQGIIAVVSDNRSAIMYEVNSETDFVARNDDFVSFVKTLGNVLLAKKPANIEEANKCSAPEFNGQSVEAKVVELIGKIGENITFRKYKKIDFNPATERIFSYVHANGKIGVIVKLSSNSGIDREEVAILGKDLAMQIAAMNPIAVDRNKVPQEVIVKEKEIYYVQAKESGKPEKIWDKIVEGKLNKFFEDMTLVEQIFVKNQEIKVSDRIKEVEKAIGSKIEVIEFVRFELGAE
ncbi:MAG: translation elongation factor Ts [Chitinispirillaceae bacterium]|nr:translation elongation factor Ts [Chitinispirillaceae bacterium]